MVILDQGAKKFAQMGLGEKTVSFIAVHDVSLKWQILFVILEMDLASGYLVMLAGWG